MDRFVERYELLDFIQENNNLNSHLAIKLNSQFKDTPQRKLKVQNASQVTPPES